MRTFIAADELVREGQPGHLATLLQPEDGTETTRKEDTLNACEGEKSLCEGT